MNFALKGQERLVLAEVRECGGFSLFWVTENSKRAEAAKRLIDRGVLVRGKDQYPWYSYTINEEKQMGEMKYVVVRSDKQGEQLFIFPKNVDHDRFAEALCVIRHGHDRDWRRIYREPVSAGFTDGVDCYGESETLKLKARPARDKELLQQGGSV